MWSASSWAKVTFIVNASLLSLNVDSKTKAHEVNL
jgi:hypothetical protein